MSKVLYPDFFNDVFGPIMQPGSSGGFAGPVRIGNVARSLVGDRPKRARIFVSAELGSLSELDTFMTDRGYLGGILGFSTEDERLFDAADQAKRTGLAFSFELAHDTALDRHTVRIVLEGAGEQRGELVAASVGGGMIEVRSVNGFATSWRADTHALVLFGTRETLEGVLHTATNTCDATLVEHTWLSPDAPGRVEAALMLELSAQPNAQQIEALRTSGDGAERVSWALLAAQLPVVTTKTRAPQLFSTIPTWEAYACEHNMSLVEAAIAYEQAFSGWSREQVWNRFERIASILHDQVHALERLGARNVAETPVLPVYGRLWEKYAQGARSLSDGLSARIISYALSTNAKIPGVLIVPGPMGTGGGYLFSAIEAVREERGCAHERVVESLVVAAMLGALAYTHTNASGERGCVGESGVCCAMTAGALAWLAGGGAREIENAASMALQANIGITCDPIPGGKEFPCITRTIRASTSAVLYADLALAGIDALIPYHEMLAAIERHYRATPPELLCGSSCGCNATPTARACQSWLQQLTRGNYESKPSL